MERCVCQICHCGFHRCNRRLLKDVLGQNPANCVLPISETHESYNGYPFKPRQQVIRPLEADWYIGRCEPSTTAAEDAFLKQQMSPESMDEDICVSQEHEETLQTYQNPEENEVQKYRDYITQKFSVPVEKYETVDETKSLPRAPLVLPPLRDVTAYTEAFTTQPPLAQMRNYDYKMKSLDYKNPDTPLDDKTQYMRDYKEWDLDCGLRAPVPNERDGKFIPENCVNIYNVPMEGMTTFRESYAMPPMDFSKFKLNLRENLPLVNSGESPASHVRKCQYHSTPEVRFTNGLLYRTAYRESYIPPCKYTRGYCSLKPAYPGSTEVKGSKERCPAETIVNNKFNSTENYKYVESCGDHHIFKNN